MHMYEILVLISQDKHMGVRNKGLCVLHMNERLLCIAHKWKIVVYCTWMKYWYGMHLIFKIRRCFPIDGTIGRITRSFHIYKKKIQIACDETQKKSEDFWELLIWFFIFLTCNTTFPLSHCWAKELENC